MDQNEDDVEIDNFGIDQEELQAFLPGGFGRQARTANYKAQIEETKRKTEETPKLENVAIRASSRSEEGSEASDDEEDEEDEDDDDTEEEEEHEFPTSHELVLKTHEKAVTTVTLDPAGGRLATGSTDCTVKLHDFVNMTPTTLRAFKSVDPTATKTSANVETHPVHQVLFNPISPSQILVITATPQARIIDRDGEVLTEFVKGDMYLRDMHNTKGHVSEVTCGAWHPTNRNLCVTAGTDSTLRIWDINNKWSQKEVIVHKSRAAGSAGRTRMTAVAWSTPAQGGTNLLVAAALDGSLAMWSGDGPYTRPAGEIRDAHIRDTWTSGLAISSDGRMVVTRGGDDTVKLWDTRKFKQPVSSVSHPSTSSQYPTSNIVYSPMSTSILTGSPTGHLHILNPANLQPEHITPITPGSPLITVLWHSKLNQIVTGSANAETHVLYDPNKSTGGAKTIMLRAPKRRYIDDDPTRTVDLAQGISGDSIIVPGAGQSATGFSARHPTIGLTASGRSRDPRRPHMPATTPFAKSQPDAEHVKHNIPLSSMRDEDPREALLKYAEKAKKDPMFTNAWKETQPVTIYGEISDEEEEPDKKKQRR